jgi:DNA mismatch repair protein MutS
MDKRDDLREPTAQRHFSLLWRTAGESEAAGAAFTLDEAATRDLEAERLFRRIAGDERRYLEIEPVFRKIPRDPDTIRYRQDAFDDLLRNPGLAEALERILPILEALGRNKRGSDENDAEIYRLACRLTELEAFVDCVTALRTAFGEMDGEPRSAAWRELRDMAEAYGGDPVYSRLAAELPDLCHRLRCVRSVCLGVNLDVNFMPSSVVMLSVDEEEYPEKSGGAFSFLFQDRKGLPSGIAPAHNLDPKKEYKYFMGAVLDPKDYGYASNPLMAPLMADLDPLLKKAAAAVNGAVARYASLNTLPFSRLRQDVLFYLRARRMVLELRGAGLPFCRPEILPASARATSIKENYNVNLAIALSCEGSGELGSRIVRNDVDLGDSGRIFVVTGPNSGGKTTYTQAIGLSQIMAQLGLPIPGTEATLSPADGVFTHFPIEEKIDRGMGRLGDEAMRLDQIFSALSGESLILFNESLSSTNAAESVFIAKDMLRVLCAAGARAVFTTHLYDLAAAVDEIGRDSGSGERIVSMVAGSGADDPANAFRIAPGAPAGKSYAREIARRYGVSYDQLRDKLKARGIIA